MNAADNKSRALRLFEELINRRNLAAIDELLVANVVDHGAWEGQAPGSEGIRTALQELYSAFTEIQVQVDEMIAEGDLVATRETWTAKPAGSNELITGTTMHHFLFRDGKLAEEWSVGWDWLEQDTTS